MAVGGNATRAVGTPDYGRFLKQGGEVPIRQAILEEEPEVSLIGTQVTVSIGMAQAINERTGFYWSTRKRGVQGPTYPFNRALLQALEFGGAIWRVIPRSGTRALEPEPRVFAQEMYKTVVPRRMYGNALTQLRTQLRTDWIGALRRSVRRSTRS